MLIKFQRLFLNLTYSWLKKQFYDIQNCILLIDKLWWLKQVLKNTTEFKSGQKWPKNKKFTAFADVKSKSLI